MDRSDSDIFHKVSFNKSSSKSQVRKNDGIRELFWEWGWQGVHELYDDMQCFPY